jgi:hypothetical protein
MSAELLLTGDGKALLARIDGLTPLLVAPFRSPQIVTEVGSTCVFIRRVSVERSRTELLRKAARTRRC